LPRPQGAEVADFVLAELPRPPARVLEVGCGQGELAEAVVAVGYDVLAIDPEAPEGAIFRRITLEELDETGLYDAVVASRSLHHVEDLDAALDKIVAILRPGGVVLLDEFAWDRLDERSAAAVAIPLAEWREEHEDLHTSKTMLAGLASRFEQRKLTWEPYLYREKRQAVTEERERELIAARRLAPIGFRYVGVRRS
jgi:SAM-dependent methyltransferase